tara:strand:- start:5442 stop:7292 length:1851 start_codon:yes stop_codon:yes gene_type:complete
MELTIGEVLQQGMALHREGKLRDAQNFYHAILRASPKHPDANHNLGLISISLNKISEAIPFFKAALDEDSSLEQYWLSYIDALIKDKQYENADKSIDQARKQEINEERLIELKASMALTNQNNEIKHAKPSKENIQKLIKYCENGKYTEAKDLAVSFTEEYPSFQFAWKLLGIVFKKTGMIKESLAASRRSVELVPQDPEAHCNLANTLKGLGRLDEAEASYTEAINIWPDFAAAHNNLGRTLHDLGRLEAAQDSFLLAIKSKSNFAAAHNNLGSTLKKLGKLDEAEASYKLAIKLQPNFAQAHNNLANLFLEMQRLKEAEKSYRKAIEYKPDHIKAYNNLGITLRGLGRLGEAEESYREALALKFDIPAAHSNLGRVLYAMGKYDAALESIEKANQIDPKSKDYELLLKLMHARKDNENSEISLNNSNDPNDSVLPIDLNTGSLILSRAPEKELIDHLCGMKSRKLNIIKNSSFNFKAFPLNFSSTEDNDSPIKNLAEDLKIIMEDAVKSEVFISDFFFKISNHDADETSHNRLTELDKDDGLKLSEQKYTLIYYLSTGDKSGSKSGSLHLYQPDKEIQPNDGMIVIIPASKKYSSICNGAENRIMIGINFYSLR